MNVKENRAWSFLIVALVYALATAVGVAVYLVLPFSVWWNVLLADIAATIVTFAFSVVFQNASVYDPYWSVQPIVILTAFAIGYGLNLSGALTLVVVSLWGIRLTANWAYTFRNLTAQDWRYTMLKEKTGALYPFVNFTGIHLVPTLVVYVCVMPAVEIIVNAPQMTVWAGLCLAVSTFAFSMQGVADVQMHKFRRSGVGGFIRTGLWKYARHPNYLGEILTWWGVGFAAFALMPQKWWLLVGALLNTCLFLFVSIPLADGRQSKKEGFAEYKAQTRALFPIKK